MVSLCGLECLGFKILGFGFRIQSLGLGYRV